MEIKRNMKQHISFVGALHIGFGLLGLAGAMTIYFGLQFLFGFFEDDPMTQKVVSYAVNSIALILVFFSSLGIIGGAGLFSYRPWARILILIVSAVNCLSVPVGTAKGIYSIWVLMQPETIEIFENSN